MVAQVPQIGVEQRVHILPFPMTDLSPSNRGSLFRQVSNLLIDLREKRTPSLGVARPLIGSISEAAGLESVVPSTSLQKEFIEVPRMDIKGLHQCVYSRLITDVPRL